MPYHALAYEIAPDYHEKTKLLGVRMIFSTVSMFGVAWIFPFTQAGWFGSPENSVRVLAIIVALVVLVSGLLPALLMKENAKEIAAVKRQRQVPLREGLGIAMRSGPFVRLLFAAGLTVVGLNMINALGTYVNVYHVHGGDARAASISSSRSRAVFSKGVIEVPGQACQSSWMFSRRMISAQPAESARRRSLKACGPTRSTSPCGSS